jgi:hypothetical protein
MPLYASAEVAKPGLELLDKALAEANRTRAGFGIEARVRYGTGDPGVWQALIQDWQSAGATHVSLLTTDCGFTTPAEHIAALKRFAETSISASPPRT